MLLGEPAPKHIAQMDFIHAQHQHPYMCVWVYVFYIYIYIYRERERENKPGMYINTNASDSYQSCLLVYILRMDLGFLLDILLNSVALHIHTHTHTHAHIQTHTHTHPD